MEPDCHASLTRSSAIYTDGKIIYGAGMTDSEILDKIVAKYGTQELAAEAFNVTRQTLHTWRKMGITLRGRFAVKAIAERHAINLPKDFIERSL